MKRIILIMALIAGLGFSAYSQNTNNSKQENLVETDSDGDGVPDKDDYCPEERGKAENGGCPIRQKISACFEDLLHYEPGKSNIDLSNNSGLNMVYNLLEMKPDSWLTIDSYTDDTYDEEKSHRVSQARADLIKDWLVSKGIVSSRIIARGHGSSDPLVPNTNAKNRARNNRIEVRLVHE